MNASRIIHIEPVVQNSTGIEKSLPKLSRPIKVGLVQINNSFSGQNYLPLSAGMLQAYVQQSLADSNDCAFLTPIYSRARSSDIKSTARSLIDADIVGFSVYTWNFNISTEIARQLKRQKPETIIAFGGPHVPDRFERPVFNAGKRTRMEYASERVEAFLRRYPFISIACHGEGERIFLSLIENAFGDWSGIPSASFLDEEGRFIQTERIPRMRDLDKFPSPYLSGTFNRLMEESPDEKWIVMWETDRGCPFSCTWCDWAQATASKVNIFGLERIYREIDWLAEHRIDYVFCANANFGILQRDLEIARYLAKAKTETGYPANISVQSTKNAQERSYLVQKILADAGMNKTVVVAMQSLNPETLKAVARDNISSEVFEANQARFAREGIETMTDLIIGQPKETYESWVSGIDKLLEMGQHNRIQFGICAVLPNAPFADPQYLERYGIETVVGPVVNIHGQLPQSNEVLEDQELVIATGTLSREDWIRTRAFSWMTAFLHCDKILQIPIIVLHQAAGLDYGEMLEYFSEGRFNELGRKNHFPILNEIREFFLEKAREIQRSGYEYCHSPEWLNIFWPADEYMFIKLYTDGKLDLFYEEAEKALRLLLRSKSIALDPKVVNEAIRLNRAQIKLPFQEEDSEIKTAFNIWDIYRSAILMEPIPLVKRPCVYRITRSREKWGSMEEWLEKVVWFGNRRGAYLYGNSNTEIQLAGHY